MANLSYRMLTVCLIAAVVLNCSNYLFMNIFYRPGGQRISKYYYPKTASGVEVQRSLVQRDNFRASIRCGNNQPAPTINIQEINDNSSSNGADYNNLAVDEANYCPELPTGLAYTQLTSHDVSQPQKTNINAKTGFSIQIYERKTAASTNYVIVTNANNDLLADSTPNERPLVCTPSIGPLSENDSQMTLQEFETKYGELKFGGIYQPTTCEARHSVAVIIAYRGCRRYLAMFLFVLHPLLIKQQLDYQIFVIEQSNNTQLFNRGKLLNVGFVEAQKYRKNGWNCLILHEPHIIPTDSRNLYRCSWYPRQLAVNVERTNKAPYIPKFGGAVAITPEQYSKVNGFSNNYWGNDADFEDLYNRIFFANYFVENGIPVLGKYKTLKKYSGAQRVKSEYMETVSPLYLLDGLTSLSYKVDLLEPRRMYTYIKVNIDDTNDTGANFKLYDRLLNRSSIQTTQIKATKVLYNQ